MAQRNVPRSLIPFLAVYADIYVEEKAPRIALKKYTEQKAPRNGEKNAELLVERNVFALLGRVILRSALQNSATWSGT